MRERERGREREERETPPKRQRDPNLIYQEKPIIVAVTDRMIERGREAFYSSR